MIVQIRPGAVVDLKVVEARLAERRGVFFEALLEGGVAAPELRSEDFVDDSCCFEEFSEGLFISRREFGRVRGDGSRSEARDHAVQVRQIWNCGQGKRHGKEER